MKDTICLIAGIVGGFIATLLGGWDSALATLCDGNRDCCDW